MSAYTWLQAEHIPCVLFCVACTGGCTVGPTLGACAGAEGAEVAGIRVVAFWGDRVGYLRTADPAVFPAFDAELPI
jgi:hypothetical protein